MEVLDCMRKNLLKWPLVSIVLVIKGSDKKGCTANNNVILYKIKFIELQLVYTFMTLAICILLAF